MLEIRDVSKTYPGKREKIEALKDVNFSVKKGELLGLLGPNGAGKTTLVKIICGLVFPDSGEVRVGDYNPWKERALALRQLSAVLEGNRNIYWPLTVRENMEFFAALKGLDPRKARDRIDDLIERLDLKEKTNVTARSLSRGMQQKLAIAVALVSDSPLLILDEPTLGLDVESALEIRSMLTAVVEEENKTIMLTTHDMRLVRAVCPRVVIINEGRIVTDDRVDNLLRLFDAKAYRLHLQGELQKEQKEKLLRLEYISIEETGGNGFFIDLTLEQAQNLYQVMDILRRGDTIIEAIERQEVDLEEVFLSILGRRDEDGKFSASSGAV